MPAIEKEEILYICDPDKNKECSKTGCHLNNGPCKYTKNPDFSKLGTSPVKAKYIVREL